MISVFYICAGASLGAVCRWLMNQWLNGIFPALPLGTLAVNWLGSCLMGMAAAFFAGLPLASPQMKLFFITGFLGSLTTFSAFAGEMGALILNGRYFLLAVGALLHVGGSICMFFVGMQLLELLRRLFGQA